MAQNGVKLLVKGKRQSIVNPDVRNKRCEDKRTAAAQIIM